MSLYSHAIQTSGGGGGWSANGLYSSVGGGPVTDVIAGSCNERKHRP